MAARSYLHPVHLTPARQLQTLVENRRIFNLEHCELNIFESYQEAYRVPLTFSDMVLTSMVRGKKVMHLHNRPAFDYLPGQSVLLPANETMVIDFPEAADANPTQCIALAVDSSYMNHTLQYLQQFYNNDTEQPADWQLQFNQYHFNNDEELSHLLNKIVRICSSGDSNKNIFADLSLKELMVRLVQSQHLKETLQQSHQSNQSRWQFVLHYIHQNLTEKILVHELCRKAYMSRNAFFKLFKERFGVTPVEYINRERIKLSKQLLSNTSNNITNVSQQCGFSDVNYFVRLFRKMEGITPGTYQTCMVRTIH
jgi:AraC-like DNA-binding protein